MRTIRDDLKNCGKDTNKIRTLYASMNKIILTLIAENKHIKRKE